MSQAASRGRAEDGRHAYGCMMVRRTASVSRCKVWHGKVLTDMGAEVVVPEDMRREKYGLV